MKIDGVTVLLPVFNGMPYLRDALESMRNQTYRDLEILVINDGSSDGTADYLAGLRDPRLRVLSQPNAGLVVTLNRGLAEARHDWIARMDADDISAPTRIAKQVAFLEEHPDYVAVGALFTFINRQNKVFSYRLGQHRYTPTAGPVMTAPPDFDPMGKIFMHASVLMDRRPVRALGGYRAGAYPAEDYDLWLRLAAHHRLACLPEGLGSLRCLPTSISAGNIFPQALAHEYVVQCAEARRAGRPEPEPAAFRSRHGLTRAQRRNALVDFHFRMFRSRWMEGQSLHAAWHLLRYGLCSPAAPYQVIASQLRKWRGLRNHHG